MRRTRSRSWSRIVAIFVAMPLVSLHFFETSGAQSHLPNIVVILIDDLGWVDLGCQGSDFYLTPQIDRLAASGMRFTDGYAAGAICSPTRAALMTGRYPARLGITDWIRPARMRARRRTENCGIPRMHDSGQTMLTAVNRHELPLAEITIAELLQPLGYTSCFIGKWHLGGESFLPTDQGFAINHGGCDYGQPPSYFDPYVDDRHPQGIPTLPPRNEAAYLTDREADEAVAFIRQHHESPFLLYLSHYAVHTPIQAKQQLIDQYGSRQDGQGQDNATYAAMIHSVDDAVGRVLTTLDELELTDQTILVLTGDNGGLDRDGDPTDNDPLRSGKGYAHEGGIRVPWIVRWPGVTSAGSISDDPICSIDLFPTLAAAVETALPEDRQIDGIDLRPALEGKPLARRPLYWHFPHYRHGPGHDPYSIIRDGDWKLIVSYDPPSMALYHLAADLQEAHDVAAANPDVVRRLRASLDQHLADVGAIVPRAVGERGASAAEGQR